MGKTAADLSRHLRVPTVVFGYEETGGSWLAQRFEAGSVTSKARSRRSWDAYFRRQELFFPSTACTPTTAGSSSSSKASSAKAVASLVYLAGRL